LRVGEIRGHGDDCVGHGVTEIGLRVSLQLHQGSRADLLRGVFLIVDLDGPVRSHMPLHGPDGAVNVRDGLALGNFADEHLAVLGEGNDGRRGPRTFGIGNDDGVSAFEDRDDRVGRSQVDTYCSSHGGFTPCSLLLRPGSGRECSRRDPLRVVL